MNNLNLLEVCQRANTIGISGHVRPDGDCVGSCMGLYLYLKKVFPQKRIYVFLEKPSEVFQCIEGIDEIKNESISDIKFDLFFAVDCSKDRLGTFEGMYDQAKNTVNVDHHISNARGTGMLNCIDPEASSASELIFRLLDKKYLDCEIAKALYIGIIHDTGVLQYSNTSPETLRAVADLITYKFDFSQMIDESFYEKTYVQNQILGRALLESILFMNGKCVVSVLDKKTMDFYQVTGKDLDGIVNQLRITRGVECAIFLYETGTLEFKVSMRSCGKVDVAKIATLFGGGGHVRAAGCTMCGTAHDVINNISEHIERQLEDIGD